MAKSLEELEKEVQIKKIHTNIFHMVKIGSVDAETYSVDLKKDEITEGKIYCPVGKFAERAK